MEGETRKRAISDPEHDDEAAPKTYRIHDGEDVDLLMEAALEKSRSDFLGTVLYQMTSQPVCEEPQDWTKYYDDVSWKLLRTELVEKSRQEEPQFINQIGLWKVVDRPAHTRIIGTRWVDVNKQDDEQPLYRSRLVGQELKSDGGDSYFAATPPLDSIKFLFRIVTTKKVRRNTGKLVDQEGKCIQLVDIRKAHFYSPATRELYVELPSECGYSRDKVGLLVRSMYGCRDAGGKLGT